VKVAGDGIDTIGPAPFRRALAAANALGASLAKYQVAGAAAYGTAALRTASNGAELEAQLSDHLGVQIQIIDGQREAELISKGVLAAGLPPEEKYLIMDIGGGSCEFIVVDKGVNSFGESYPIGAQVLRQRFHQQEPLRATPTSRLQEEALFAHLTATLSQLTDAIGTGAKLVGASGTFDVLGDLFGEPINEVVNQVPAEQVLALYNEAVQMNEADRLADDRLPDDRADMIVVALALIVHVLSICPQKQVLTCDYALKEGALLEMAIAHGV